MITHLVKLDGLERSAGGCKERGLPFTFDVEAACGIKLPSTSASTSTVVSSTGSSSGSASSTASSTTGAPEASSSGSQTSSGGVSETSPAGSGATRGVVLTGMAGLVAASGLLLLW